MEKRNIRFINAFALKIIAILSVLSDHIAFAFVRNDTLHNMMRIFGRLAFPLFAFFIVQGIIHSRNRNKYLLRLTYIYIVLQVFIAIAYFFSGTSFPNVFMTLLSGAAFLTYLHEKRWKEVYLLVPILVTVALNITANYVNNDVLMMFTGDYGNYGLFMIVSFYAAYVLTKQYLEMQNIKYFNTPSDTPLDESYEKVFNVFSSISLFVTHGIWYIFEVFSISNTSAGMQHYALLTIVLLLLYSGKLGHNSKVWRWIYYLFFPIHLAIIALITLLI
ncbi:MAG TPA: TraX family protein [Bacilli bacterium]|nr:TraX family protein [Bacilli bacterium]